MDVGVFWVVMRVLACGGLGVLVWEGMTGQLAKRKTIEVRLTLPCSQRMLIEAHGVVVSLGYVVTVTFRTTGLSLHRTISAIIHSVCGISLGSRGL